MSKLSRVSVLIQLFFETIPQPPSIRANVYESFHSFSSLIIAVSLVLSPCTHPIAVLPNLEPLFHLPSEEVTSLFSSLVVRRYGSQNFCELQLWTWPFAATADRGRISDAKSRARKRNNPCRVGRVTPRFWDGKGDTELFLKIKLAVSRATEGAIFTHFV